MNRRLHLVLLVALVLVPSFFLLHIPAVTAVTAPADSSLTPAEGGATPEVQGPPAPAAPTPSSATGGTSPILSTPSSVSPGQQAIINNLNQSGAAGDASKLPACKPSSGGTTSQTTSNKLNAASNNNAKCKPSAATQVFDCSKAYGAKCNLNGKIAVNICHLKCDYTKDRFTAFATCEAPNVCKGTGKCTEKDEKGNTKDIDCSQPLKPDVGDSASLKDNAAGGDSNSNKDLNASGACPADPRCPGGAGRIAQLEKEGKTGEANDLTNEYVQKGGDPSKLARELEQETGRMGVGDEGYRRIQEKIEQLKYLADEPYQPSFPAPGRSIARDALNPYFTRTPTADNPFALKSVGIPSGGFTQSFRTGFGQDLTPAQIPYDINTVSVRSTNPSFQRDVSTFGGGSTFSGGSENPEPFQLDTSNKPAIVRWFDEKVEAAEDKVIKAYNELRDFAANPVPLDISGSSADLGPSRGVGADSNQGDTPARTIDWKAAWSCPPSDPTCPPIPAASASFGDSAPQKQIYDPRLQTALESLGEAKEELGAAAWIRGKLASGYQSVIGFFGDSSPENPREVSPALGHYYDQGKEGLIGAPSPSSPGKGCIPGSGCGNPFLDPQGDRGPFSLTGNDLSRSVAFAKGGSFGDPFDRGEFQKSPLVAYENRDNGSNENTGADLRGLSRGVDVGTPDKSNTPSIGWGNLNLANAAKEGVPQPDTRASDFNRQQLDTPENGSQPKIITGKGPLIEASTFGGRPDLTEKGANRIDCPGTPGCPGYPSITPQEAARQAVDTYHQVQADVAEAQRIADEKAQAAKTANAAFERYEFEHLAQLRNTTDDNGERAKGQYRFSNPQDVRAFNDLQQSARSANESLKNAQRGVQRVYDDLPPQTRAIANLGREIETAETRADNPAVIGFQTEIGRRDALAAAAILNDRPGAAAAAGQLAFPSCDTGACNMARDNLVPALAESEKVYQPPTQQTHYSSPVEAVVDYVFSPSRWLTPGSPQSPAELQAEIQRADARLTGYADVAAGGSIADVSPEVRTTLDKQMQSLSGTTAGIDYGKILTGNWSESTRELTRFFSDFRSPEQVARSFGFGDETGPIESAPVSGSPPEQVAGQGSGGRSFLQSAIDRVSENFGVLADFGTKVRKQTDIPLDIVTGWPKGMFDDAVYAVGLPTTEQQIRDSFSTNREVRDHYTNAVGNTALNAFLFGGGAGSVGGDIASLAARDTRAFLRGGENPSAAPVSPISIEPIAERAPFVPERIVATYEGTPASGNFRFEAVPRTSEIRPTIDNPFPSITPRFEQPFPTEGVAQPIGLSRSPFDNPLVRFGSEAPTARFVEGPALGPRAIEARLAQPELLPARFEAPPTAPALSDLSIGERAGGGGLVAESRPFVPPGIPGRSNTGAVLEIEGRSGAASEGVAAERSAVPFTEAPAPRTPYSGPTAELKTTTDNLVSRAQALERAGIKDFSTDPYWRDLNGKTDELIARAVNRGDVNPELGRGYTGGIKGYIEEEAATRVARNLRIREEVGSKPFAPEGATREPEGRSAAASGGVPRPVSEITPAQSKAIDTANALDQKYQSHAANPDPLTTRISSAADADIQKALGDAGLKRSGGGVDLVDNQGNVVARKVLSPDGRFTYEPVASLPRGVSKPVIGDVVSPEAEAVRAAANKPETSLLSPKNIENTEIIAAENIKGFKPDFSTNAFKKAAQVCAACMQLGGQGFAADIAKATVKLADNTSANTLVFKDAGSAFRGSGAIQGAIDRSAAASAAQRAAGRAASLGEGLGTAPREVSAPFAPTGPGAIASTLVPATVYEYTRPVKNTFGLGEHKGFAIVDSDGTLHTYEANNISRGTPFLEKIEDDPVSMQAFSDGSAARVPLDMDPQKFIDAYNKTLPQGYLPYDWRGLELGGNPNSNDFAGRVLENGGFTPAQVADLSGTLANLKFGLAPGLGNPISSAAAWLNNPSGRIWQAAADTVRIAYDAVTSALSPGGAQANYSKTSGSPRENKVINDQIRQRSGLSAKSNSFTDPAADGALAKAAHDVLGGKGILNKTVFPDPIAIQAVMQALSARETRGEALGPAEPVSPAKATGRLQVQPGTGRDLGAPRSATDPIDHYLAALRAINDNANAAEAQLGTRANHDSVLELAANKYNQGQNLKDVRDLPYGREVVEIANEIDGKIRRPGNAAPTAREIRAINRDRISDSGARNIQRFIVAARAGIGGMLENIGANIGHAVTHPIQTVQGIFAGPSRPIPTATPAPVVVAPTNVAHVPLPPARPAGIENAGQSVAQNVPTPPARPKYIGSVTAPSEVAAITRNLRPGMTGEDVKALQRFLGIPADGIFGPQTKQAVADWQKANNISIKSADYGNFGPISRSTIIAEQSPGDLNPAPAAQRSVATQPVSAAPGDLNPSPIAQPSAFTLPPEPGAVSTNVPAPNPASALPAEGAKSSVGQTSALDRVLLNVGDTLARLVGLNVAASPYNPVSGRALSDAVNLTCKATGCDAILIYKGLSGVAGFESSGDAQVWHASQYQGFGQVGAKETQEAIRALAWLSQSPRLTADEQQRVSFIVRTASYGNPNQDTVLGPWILVGHHLANNTLNPVSMVANDGHTAAGYLALGQFSPGIFKDFNPNAYLPSSAVWAINAQPAISRMGFGVNQGTTVGQAAANAQAAFGGKITQGINAFAPFTPGGAPSNPLATAQERQNALMNDALARGGISGPNYDTGDIFRSNIQPPPVVVNPTPTPTADPALAQRKADLEKKVSILESFTKVAEAQGKQAERLSDDTNVFGLPNDIKGTLNATLHSLQAGRGVAQTAGEIGVKVGDEKLQSDAGDLERQINQTIPRIQSGINDPSSLAGAGDSLKKTLDQLYASGLDITARAKQAADNQIARDTAQIASASGIPAPQAVRVAFTPTPRIEPGPGKVDGITFVASKNAPTKAQPGGPTAIAEVEGLDGVKLTCSLTNVTACQQAFAKEIAARYRVPESAVEITSSNITRAGAPATVPATRSAAVVTPAKAAPNAAQKQQVAPQQNLFDRIANYVGNLLNNPLLLLGLRNRKAGTTPQPAPAQPTVGANPPPPTPPQAGFPVPLAGHAPAGTPAGNAPQRGFPAPLAGPAAATPQGGFPVALRATPPPALAPTGILGSRGQLIAEWARNHPKTAIIGGAVGGTWLGGAILGSIGLPSQSTPAGAGEDGAGAAGAESGAGAAGANPADAATDQPIPTFTFKDPRTQQPPSKAPEAPPGPRQPRAPWSPVPGGIPRQGGVPSYTGYPDQSGYGSPQQLQQAFRAGQQRQMQQQRAFQAQQQRAIQQQQALQNQLAQQQRQAQQATQQRNTTPPTIDFHASPAIVARNASTDLIWQSTNTTACYIFDASGKYVAQGAQSGSYRIAVVPQTTIYSMTCTSYSYGQNTYASTTVKVATSTPAISTSTPQYSTQ